MAAGRTQAWATVVTADGRDHHPTQRPRVRSRGGLRRRAHRRRRSAGPGPAAAVEAALLRRQHPAGLGQPGVDHERARDLDAGHLDLGDRHRLARSDRPSVLVTVIVRRVAGSSTSRNSSPPGSTSRSTVTRSVSIRTLLTRGPTNRESTKRTTASPRSTSPSKAIRHHCPVPRPRAPCQAVNRLPSTAAGAVASTRREPVPRSAAELDASTDRAPTSRSEVVGAGSAPGAVVVGTAAPAATTGPSDRTGTRWSVACRRASSLTQSGRSAPGRTTATGPSTRSAAASAGPARSAARHRRRPAVVLRDARGRPAGPAGSDRPAAGAEVAQRAVGARAAGPRARCRPPRHPPRAATTAPGSGVPHGSWRRAGRRAAARTARRWRPARR